MKKNILFVMESLRMGGAEKSLLTLLNFIDYDKYDVDLFLFNHDGEFMQFLPKEVNLLNKSTKYKVFLENRKKAPLNFIFSGDFKSSYQSLKYLVKCLFYKIRGKFYIGWECIQYFFDSISKEYDVSIAYLERKSLYFNIDKVNAKKKIGFIHNNYHKYDYDYNFDKKYFQAYDKIATVSNCCKDALIDIFPEYKDKFIVIRNMVSKSMIKNMAEEKMNDINKEDINIVTVGRLVYQKGLDNAIDICKLLVERNYNIKWFVLGKGEEEKNLKEKIKKYNLEKNFILAGAQINPYKWMKNADIYVTTSRFEGYAVTVIEAKALAKPIVTTNILEFKEQIIDGENGYIAKNNEEMCQRIIDLIENKNNIKNKFIENLKNDKTIENLGELEKFYSIID